MNNGRKWPYQAQHRSGRRPTQPHRPGGTSRVPSPARPEVPATEGGDGCAPRLCEKSARRPSRLPPAPDPTDGRAAGLWPRTGEREAACDDGRCESARPAECDGGPPPAAGAGRAAEGGSSAPSERACERPHRQRRGGDSGESGAARRPRDNPGATCRSPERHSGRAHKTKTQIFCGRS